MTITKNFMQYKKKTAKQKETFCNVSAIHEVAFVRSPNDVHNDAKVFYTFVHQEYFQLNVQ